MMKATDEMADYWGEEDRGKEKQGAEEEEGEAQMEEGEGEEGEEGGGEKSKNLVVDGEKENERRGQKRNLKDRLGKTRVKMDR